MPGRRLRRIRRTYSERLLCFDPPKETFAKVSSGLFQKPSVRTLDPLVPYGTSTPASNASGAMLTARKRQSGVAPRDRWTPLFLCETFSLTFGLSQRPTELLLIHFTLNSQHSTLSTLSHFHHLVGKGNTIKPITVKNRTIAPLRDEFQRRIQPLKMLRNIIRIIRPKILLVR